MANRININGITRDMTEAEIAELEALAADMPEPEKDPTETRLDEIEAAMIELAAQQAATEEAQEEAETALIELAAMTAETEV